MPTPPIKPPIDLNNLLDDMTALDPVAEDLAKRTKTWLLGIGTPALPAQLIAGVVGAQLGLFLGLIGLIITIVVMVGDPIIRVFLRVLTKVRTDTVPEQVDISASVLSEFLATEISVEHLRPGKTGDQTIDAARAIGGALLDRLTKEFVPQGTVTPDSGENAAKAFAGYGVNFAVQNTMISTLADALSFHLLEDFRELGVEVAQNLGLGRLVRQALLPLIRNSIAEPYDQQLRKRYRPDRVSDQQGINLWAGGLFNDDELNDLLQVKGFKDGDIERLKRLLVKKLNSNDAELLMRHKIITEEQAIRSLTDDGESPALADQHIKAQQLQRVESLVQEYKAVIRKQRIDLLLDEDTYNILLDRLPISDDEKLWERNIVGITLELPRAFPTKGELKTLFDEGLIDLDYIDQYFSRLGFSPDDENLEEFLFLIELGKFTDKEKAKADKAARAAAKKASTPPTSPPNLP